MEKFTKRLGAWSVLLFWLLVATGAHAQRMFLASVAPKGETYMEMAASDSIALFLPESSALSLTLNTNLKPTAEASADWCSATFTLGRLRVQVEANSGEGVRTGVVSIVGKDGHSAAIKVKQLGTAPAVITKEERIRLKDNTATFSVDLRANAEFTTELPDWIKLSGKSTVVGAERYTFTATRLDEPGEREGVLRFVPEGGEATTLPVWQNYVDDPRFAVISDIHFGNNEGEGPMVKVPQALRNLVSKSGLDAIFICGDLTDGGQAGQYEQLLSVFKDPAVIPQDLPVYFLTGNHDNYDANGIENFAVLGQPLYDFIDIKGYPFIKISMKTSNGSNAYDDEAREFLKEALERAERDYPGRPIFVFTHVPPYNTVYGSCPGDGGWGTETLSDILEDYPQVVIFSGHSHFPLGDPRSIDQGAYTSINVGSTTYSELEPDVVDEGIHPNRYAYVTEGVIVTADRASNLTVERWDTYNDEEILPRWTITAPHDGTQFTYADRDGGKAPWFDADATITVSDITENGCTVTFPQAQDDEVVHHYVVEIVDTDGKVVNSNRRFSGFYLNSHQPQSISVDFSGVPSGTELTARVRGIDSYDNASEPLTSAPFRTSTYEPDPSVTAPEAALFDLVWADDGTATDVSPLANPVRMGSDTPVMERDEAHDRTIPYFKGNENCFYRIDYASQPAIKAAFQKGFTFEAIYTPDNTDNMCVISAQQSGCAGIEQGSGGAIQFFTYIDGDYRILKSAISAVPGQTYHVVTTYDAEAGRTCIYVNGELTGSMSTPGELTFPSEESAHWIAIGGDASTGDYIQYALAGSIAVARMYDKAVSRDEAYQMYKREFPNDIPEYEPDPSVTAPDATLFDIIWTDDGTATDVSPLANPIKAGSDAPDIERDEVHDRAIPHFKGNENCFYRIDYASQPTIKAAMQKGFTLEAVYTPDNTDNVCVVSAQEFGGAGIEQGNGGLIQFFAYVGGSYRILKSIVTAIPGQTYHVVATYDAATEHTYIYINGQPAGSMNAPGELTFPSDESAHWFAIGGDASPENSIQYPLKGSIAVARMYDKAVSRDEAYRMYEREFPKK